MKSLAGRLFFAAIWLVMLGITVSGERDRFIEAHPGASGWDFALFLAPTLGQILLALALLGVLARLIWPRVTKWSSPREDRPPPADAGPLYAARTYPLHVLVCLLMIGVSTALLFSWPGAAMVAVALTIAAWVSLGRRLGFEPADDPAAPRNQARS